MAENRQIDRRQFLTALAGGGVAGLFVMGSGSTGPAGSNANVGPGTANKLAKFLSANTIGDSALSDDGANISSSESFLPAGDNVQDLGSTAKRWSTINAVGIGNPGGGLNLTVNSTLIPISDNLKDLGLASLRWRFLYAEEISAGSGTLQIDSGGDLIANVNSGALGSAYRPTSAGDGNTNLGLSNRRWRNIFLSQAIGVYATSGAANPTVQVQASEIDFGPGGAAAVDVYLKRISAGLWETQAIRPQTDATYDLGTSSLRNRDIYASRRVIIATKNALVLDGQSMTQSSHTVSNADTDIATYSLGANSYTRIIVRITGYVSFVTLSTNQSINLKIKDGTTQVGNTMVIDGALSASASIPFTLEAAFVETGAVTIHFTEGAAAADANTTVFINSIIMLAES
ncbi:MAG: hypothetical protein DMG30_13885 [Acidobacteria bacterium]|nr:MAG: hypothetical protein DMG30_13885 [Acidobacteriota bacterium]